MAWLMDLPEDHLLILPMQRPPESDPAFQGPSNTGLTPLLRRLLKRRNAKVLAHLRALLSLLLQRGAAILGQENPRIRVTIAA